jgi:hypothetical protein
VAGVGGFWAAAGFGLKILILKINKNEEMNFFWGCC